MPEPKKETVRIALPPRPEQAVAAPSIAKRDTARTVLPSHTPVTPIRRLPPKISPLPASESSEAPTILPRRPPVIAPASAPLLQPLPKPPGTETKAEPSAPSVIRGPQEDTVRISVRPRPTPTDRPAMNMTNTEPLLIHPMGKTSVAPVVITSKPIAPRDVIPRSLAWSLLGISVVIFLIQIWNYVVS